MAVPLNARPVTDDYFDRGAEMTYLFFREGGFYTVSLKDDMEAVANAQHNPGTLKVETTGGRLVWPKPEHKQ